MKKFIIAFIFCTMFVLGKAQQKSVSWQSKNIFQTDYFIENKGQFDRIQDHCRGVQFAYQHAGQQYFFTSSGFSIQAFKKVKKSNYVEEEEEESMKRKHLTKAEREAEEMIENKKKYETVQAWIDIEWQHANKNTVIESTNASSHYFSYGDAPYLSKGYKILTYKNLYNNIDLKYEIHGKEGIKYSLILRPGARLEDISFKYLGEHISVHKTKEGLRFNNAFGEWKETQLKAFYENGETVDIAYDVKDLEVHFRTAKPLDPSKVFIIDPFVTPLTTLASNNYGFDIEHDLDGNLLVFGGGGFIPDYPKVAKYDPLGNLLWTFMGVVVSTSWTTGDNVGNFVVDKHNSKIYVSDGLNGGGASAIRLTTNGVYDNFVSLPDPDLIEIWEMKINCVTGDVIAMGGGSSSDLNFGVIDTLSGAVTTSNVTGVFGGNGHQDIVNATIGPSAEVYILINSLTYSVLDNHLLKVNSNYTSSFWNVYSGYNTFTEPFNKPFVGGLSNGFNALASDSNFLYYYDGQNLKAFNAATGASVGTPIMIVGAGMKSQGGIYANVCHDVFVGTTGAILKYNFNGSTFNFITSLPITGQSNSIVTDIVYNELNHLLYVTGNGFVATIDPQGDCLNGNSGLIQLSYTTLCPDKAFVTVTNPIAGAGYTFIWQDSATNAILQTTQHLAGQNTDTLSGLIDGTTYKVNVLLASACQIISNDIIFTLNCPGIQINLCPGQTYTLSNGTIIKTAGTYVDTLKNQAGLDSVITVKVLYFQAYKDSINAEICSIGQYVLPNGNSVNVAGVYTNSFLTEHGCDSVIVVNLKVVTALPQHFLGNDTSLCEGGAITLNQTIFNSPATYLWEDHSNHPIRTLKAAGTYQLTISLPPCPDVTDEIELNYHDCSCETFIPNAFTPNGDGKNEVFRPRLKCIYPPSNYSLQIYNRYGQRVFVTEKLEQGWNGTFYGDMQELGTYMYMISFVNTMTGKSEFFKGDVLLVR